MTAMTTPSSDNFASNDNDTKKPGDTLCVCSSTLASACAIILWILCMATNDCWTACKDPATKASILGFGIFVLFMVGVETAFSKKEETLSEEMDALNKELAKVKTCFGKLGYLAYNFTVFVTLVAELNAILDTETEMWYREQALYMYGFLMYSNAAGAKLWSVVHTLVFSLFSDSIAFKQDYQAIMNPRTLGLIVGYYGIAYEVIQRRDDAAIIKEHAPVRSISFFPLLVIPSLSAVNPLLETSVIHYLVIGVCILYCSSGMPNGKMLADESWMGRSLAHLYHASIWTQIAVVLLESLDGTTGTRSLWTLGFLLYAHVASFTAINICFVWGITILGAVNNVGYNQGNLPLTTTVAVVRTLVMVLAFVDHYYSNPKEKDGEDASKSKDQADAGTVVLFDGDDAIEYVPLVDAA